MSLKSEVSDFSVFDSHCHLEFMQWRNAAIETLSHCMERDGEDLGDKFRGCIVNFCQPGQWSQGARGESVLQLLRESARDARIGISLGCHPHFANKMTKYRWKQLERLVSAPSKVFPWLEVVAFRECGLDYSHKNSMDRNKQIEVFEKMLIRDWCRMEKRLFGTGAEWKKGCLALVPIIQKWLIGTGPFHISGP